ncbi:TniQ family protein [Nocardia sp. CA-107356]|uniref:TniQ family protein n=1 Tax=Nocardia sp. CA-107356 TaxID=3239972 RepID=UPI003D90301A
MPPFGFRPGPPHRLPFPVAPFHGETIGSYLYRLATANLIHPDDLRIHLIGTPNRPAAVPLASLAAATGRAPQDLIHALPELRPGVEPGTTPPLPAHVRRRVCLRCARRRSTFVFAVTWKPVDTVLCPKHRIWLGSRGRSYLDQQYNVDGLTDILRAQRRHQRLAHHVGPTIAALAFTEATRITGTWARHGRHLDRRNPLIRAFRTKLPLTGKLHNGDPLTAVVTYPETVDLAHVLADFRWRYPRPGLASTAIHEFARAVNHTLGINYQHSTEGYDGLYPWLRKRHTLVDPDHQRSVDQLLSKNSHPDRQSDDLPHDQ